MVKKLPTFFVTFTADEVSATRWSECADMESLMEEVLQHNVSHTDIPIENAALCVHRLNHFFADYLLGGPEILGHIDHHLIR